jgi:hypothetical protein
MPLVTPCLERPYQPQNRHRWPRSPSAPSPSASNIPKAQRSSSAVIPPALPPSSPWLQTKNSNSSSCFPIARAHLGFWQGHCSAGCQTCCIADFHCLRGAHMRSWETDWQSLESPIGRPWPTQPCWAIVSSAGLATRDTADWAVCATLVRTVCNKLRCAPIAPIELVLLY